MRDILVASIDWVSIKMNGICIGLAIFSGSAVLSFLAGVATATTIIYNAIRIIKELKSNKKQKTNL